MKGKEKIKAKNKELSLLKKELDEIKTPEGKLSLVDSPIQQNQLLTILQRTPKEHIYTRPGRGGKTFEYVTGNYVKKVLNYVFAWLWDFQIIDKGREDKQVWVLGRLTIKNKNGDTMIIKEQFGRQDLKFLKDGTGLVDYGNDLKGAATDALKKCASELGIASDIYGANEFKEIQLKSKENIKLPLVKDVLTKIKNLKTKEELVKSKEWIEKKEYNEIQKNILYRAIEEQEKLCG